MSSYSRSPGVGVEDGRAIEKLKSQKKLPGDRDNSLKQFRKLMADWLDGSEHKGSVEPALPRAVTNASYTRDSKQRPLFDQAIAAVGEADMY